MKTSLYKKIDNDKQGFKELISWIRSLKINLKETYFCMEHTGIYGYEIALFLESKKIPYSMVGGLEIKHSQGLARGKSDKVYAA